MPRNVIGAVRPLYSSLGLLGRLVNIGFTPTISLYSNAASVLHFYPSDGLMYTPVAVLNVF